VLPRLIVLTVVAFVGICVAVDMRTRRIPNVVSGPALLAGVLVNAFYFGLPGLWGSVLGATLTMAALLWPFAMGGIGAGDVKMMGAVGAFLGARLALAGMLTGMLLGGLIMAAHLLRIGRLGEKLAATGRMFMVAAATRSVTPLRVSASEPDAVSLPYSLPLALGIVTVLAAQAYLRVS